MDHATRPNSPIALCLGILAATAGIAALSTDSLLILACGSVIAIAVTLLWRVGEPPVLFMAAGIQLSQVIVPPLHASSMGVPLEDAWLHVGNMTQTTWFALAALLSLVVGMWCGHLGARPIASVMRLEATSWSPRTAFVLCVATLFLSAALSLIGSMYEGLRQPLLAASRVDWVGAFVLTYVCAAQRRGLIYVLLITLFEVAKGFSGFFADFKEIFIVLFVGFAAGTPRLGPRAVITGAILAGIVLALGTFWSAVKTDYRKYVSQGSGQQTVLVSADDQFTYLMDRVSEFDGEAMEFGLDRLAKRWGYLDLLTATMRNVPAQLPFENGALIGTAVLHVLQPRFLFPDKPPLPSDTDIAVRYSGLGLDKGGNAVNTSISLGYVAELYIDFGIVGALVAMFILGFLAGRVVRYLTASTALPAILSSGLAVVFMMSMASFEQALVKMIGSAVTTFIVILALRSLLLPYLLSIFGPAAAVKLGVDLPHGAGRMDAGT